jgi:hypothetical protein
MSPRAREPRPRRRRPARTASTACTLALRPRLCTHRIRHAIAIGLRHLLHAPPPRSDGGIREAHVGAQQQQVEAGTEARLFQHAQRAPAARLLEPRLRGEHFAHAQREALGNRDAALRGARRAVDGIDNRADVVPLLLRLLLDDLGDRPYSSSANRKVGVTGLPCATRWSVFTRPCAAAHHRAVGMRRGRRPPSAAARQQPALLQHFEAAARRAGQEQLERLVEQARRRHAA